MKYCEQCKLEVNTNKDYCPLCYNEFDDNQEVSSENLIYKNKEKNEKTTKNKAFITKLFMYLTICTIVICSFINFLTNKSVFWSLVVACGIIYVWVLIKHTILSRRALFEKVLFQLLGIFLILFFSYKISGSGDWFWNYVIPSIAIMTTLVLLIVYFSIYKKSDHLISFFILFLLLIILSAVLLLAKIDTFKLLNEINLILNGLIILGILILAFKQLKNSFMKTFNL